MKPLITVITGVYNDEKFIKKSVESILRQTYKDFEYIIVDDGSTDNTLEILRDFERRYERIKVVTQPNRGVAVARNTALNLASGNFIAFQDSDDISAPNRLEKQLSHLLRVGKSNMISCTGYYIIDNKDNVITNNNKRYQNINRNILKGRFCACHASMMMPKKIILDVGGYNSFYKKTEDYDMILRLLENKAHIEKIDECLYNYRIRENSEGSMNNGEWTKRVYENHLNRISGRAENFNLIVNQSVPRNNYLIVRQAHELFYSEKYSMYRIFYFRCFYKLPFKYFIYFCFSILPNVVKRLIKNNI